MPVILLSFLAGVLTVLAPCVLPILPVVIGQSSAKNDAYKPYRVLLGLGVSIFIFSILLKLITLFLPIPQQIWQLISGGIIVFFGVTYIFPNVYEKIVQSIPFLYSSQSRLSTASNRSGIMSDFLVGGALGPVFAGCSPTFAVILATILPANIFLGSLYLLTYIFGLLLALLPIVLFGRSFIRLIQNPSRPHSLFKKIIGILFICIGLAIIFSFDKYIEAQIVQAGSIDWIIRFENQFLAQFRR